MRRILAVALLVMAAVGLTASPALAGPGCPDTPGVCSPGNDFPW